MEGKQLWYKNGLKLNQVIQRISNSGIPMKKFLPHGKSQDFL